MTAIATFCETWLSRKTPGAIPPKSTSSCTAALVVCSHKACCPRVPVFITTDAVGSGRVGRGGEKGCLGLQSRLRSPGNRKPQIQMGERV